MNPYIIFDSEDKSVYADQLSEWTGRPRGYWTFVPLWILKRLYERKRRDRMSVKNQSQDHQTV